MSGKRNRHMSRKTVNIKMNSNFSQIHAWLHDRLFLLKDKFSFFSPGLGENSYVFINNLSVIPSSFIVSASLNRRENLGEVEIVLSNLEDGNVNISYQYLPKLSDFAANLILDIGFYFNILNEIPGEILNQETKYDGPDEKTSSTLELELFIENVPIDEFADWLFAESKDILSKLFPTIDGVLQIQPLEILSQSDYEKKFAMKGKLYEFGWPGTALFLPDPPTNARCVYFEIRKFSTNLRILYRANKLAIVYFSELLNKVEHNWPNTGEKIQLFLLEHMIGESVASIQVGRMGPEIDKMTGEITPELEKFYRLEFNFKGSPSQFSAFITNYGSVLSDKYQKEIVNIIGPQSMNIDPVQVKAVFLSIDFLEPGREKGIYGTIIAQSIPDQKSLLKVEVKRENWPAVKQTWEIIFAELERQGWITGDDIQTGARQSSIEAKPKGNIGVGGNVSDSLFVSGDNNTVNLQIIKATARKSKNKPKDS